MILFATDWSMESNRPTLNFLLRRLDKTIQKIGKKMTFRRRINWTALTEWLNGLHQTLVAHPYIAYLHPLKVKAKIYLIILISQKLIFFQENI